MNSLLVLGINHCPHLQLSILGTTKILIVIKEEEEEIVIEASNIEATADEIVTGVKIVMDEVDLLTTEIAIIRMTTGIVIQMTTEIAIHMTTEIVINITRTREVENIKVVVHIEEKGIIKITLDDISLIND